MDTLSIPALPSPKTTFTHCLDTYSRSRGAASISNSPPVKPKQSKSRNGCITCKAKRLKCDETKPSCDQCHKRGVACGGYKKDFKWRPFEESSIANRVAKPSRKGNKKKVSSSPRSAPASMEPESRNNHLTSPFYPPEVPVAAAPLYLPTPPETAEYMMVASPESPHKVDFSDEASIASTMSSPNISDMLAAPDFLDIPGHSPEIYGLHGCLSLPVTDSGDGGVDGEVIRTDAAVVPWNMFPSWPSVESSGTVNLPSSASPEDFGFISAFDTFRRPLFAPSSTEMIRSYFDKNTCGIMSVKDGPTENPWRMELWPIAQESPALLHAISAMTAFHMSLEFPEMRFEGREHQRKSLRFLNQGLSHSNIKDDAALATTLVLAFADAFDSPTSTGTVYLRGGRGLIYKFLEKQDDLSGNLALMRRFKFLYNVWVYLDVLARLTSNVDDDLQPPMVHGRFKPSREVDPLLGCAETLFPLLGRVASIGQRVRRSKKNTVMIISEAADLQKQLQDWTPAYDYDYEPLQDSSSSVQHCIQTAEAYRWATLLHLHQAVPELPSPSSHDLAQKVMTYLASIPDSSRSCIIHIYPLLAAGCEASGQEERQWVMKRWDSMANRLRIGNVGKARQVTQEVWARRDQFMVQRQASLERERSLSPQSIRYSSPPTDHAPSSSQDLLQWQHSHGYPRQLSPGSPISGCSTRRMGSNTLGDNELEYESSMRGNIHWTRVMVDWGWEVLLG